MHIRISERTYQIRSATTTVRFITFYGYSSLTPTFLIIARVDISEGNDGKFIEQEPYSNVNNDRVGYY